MNAVYAKLLKKLDKKEKQALIAAEKAWVAFRDLECKFECTEYEGGSIFSSMNTTCAAKLTEARTAALQAILTEKESR